MRLNSQIELDYPTRKGATFFDNVMTKEKLEYVETMGKLKGKSGRISRDHAR